MKHEKTLEDLLCACDARGIDRKLALSVVLSLDEKAETTAWEDVCQNLRDAAKHGADTGFSGFTYYTETVAFYRKHRESILRYLRRMAEDLGESGPITVVRGFSCFRRNEVSEDEVAVALYAPPKEDGEIGDDFVLIANALAWFALEEVARVFVDLEEEST